MKDTGATTLEVVPVGKRTDIAAKGGGTAAFRTKVNRTEMAGSCKMAVALELADEEHFFRYSGVHYQNVFAVCEVVHRCHVQIPSGRTRCPGSTSRSRAPLTIIHRRNWRPVGLFHKGRLSDTYTTK